VVTNVDPDHLSNWGTAQNYADGFLPSPPASGSRAGDQRRRSRRGGLTARVRTVRRELPYAVMTFGECGAPTSDPALDLAGTGSSFDLEQDGAGGR
jgi:UDP-N-acetylmuramate--alanine ligase